MSGRAFLLAGLSMLPASARAGNGASEPAPPSTNPWALVADPAPGEARSIGGTSAGCLAGAAELSASGPGFRVAEPERRRTYGHPALVAFIRDLGRAVARRGLGTVPVGDMSQPRGGPADSGHASHQTGLDVDLWYADARPGRRPRKVAMVDLRRNRPTRSYGRRVAAVVELAAADPRVDRVFVNPVIKAELCRGRRPRDRAWLRKVRPWWLHHEHFHVRLACPADSPDCVAQDAIGSGDGCGDIAWWLQPRSETERADKRKAYRSRVGAVPSLPAGCAAVLGR